MGQGMIIILEAAPGVDSDIRDLPGDPTHAKGLKKMPTSFSVPRQIVTKLSL